MHNSILNELGLLLIRYKIKTLRDVSCIIFYYIIYNSIYKIKNFIYYTIRANTYKYNPE